MSEIDQILRHFIAGAVRIEDNASDRRHLDLPVQHHGLDPVFSDRLQFLLLDPLPFKQKETVIPAAKEISYDLL